MKVLRAVAPHAGHIQFAVIAGAANPHVKELQSFVNTLGSQFELIHHTDEMPKMMAWADLGIFAGGSTCWEAAFMGLPMIVITTVAHQESLAAALKEHKLALSLGWWEDVREQDILQALRLLANLDLRAELSSRAQTCVDGGGAVRVILAMEHGSDRPLP
jgi:UDP-2,4-diacetamido-2,4,6-trideoxy-beta-L-altropyranose hydrolase